MTVETVDEHARLEALGRYRILDTEPERAFDDLTLLAAQVCGTPIALISLVDADRQWFKSRVGLSLPETSRSVAFCAHAIRQPDTFIVQDAHQHQEFVDNPLVTGEPGIRFYAGAPLVSSDGHALGTLCVIDRVPRTLTQDQLEALEALRRQAQAQLELRRNLIELQEMLEERERAGREQERLATELRSALDGVRKLSALLPLCSACEMNMVIPADPAMIPTVTDGVVQLLQEHGWGSADVMAVELALQEAIANAIRHGCRNDPSHQVQCCLTSDEAGELMIVVRDPGPGFEPTAVPNPLEGDNVLKPGGRGIFLINELMDEVGFGAGGREILMRKRREKP
jgi:anti-sigma regulatory factor (Ser/Thr protein kinase)